MSVFALTGCGVNTDKVVIGSKDFSENIVLGEMLAQLVEEHTDIKVERKLNMGGTFVAFEALKRGDISVYVEYTGTGLTAQLKMDVISDPDESYSVVKEKFNTQFDLKWLDPIGLNNTYSIAVAGELAEEYNLKKISDLTAISNDLIFGAEHEFFNRQDGFEGFVELYDIKFAKINKMNVSLKYQAIGEGKMDVTDVFATDGQIKKYGLIILEDDLEFFPPYYAAPVVRNDIIAAHPEVEEILNMLAGKINDKVMTELNYKIDVELESVEDVATDFLKSVGLID
jgi:osmoprotectant transport system substrate-binding protein